MPAIQQPTLRSLTQDHLGKRRSFPCRQSSHLHVLPHHKVVAPSLTDPIVAPLPFSALDPRPGGRWSAAANQWQAEAIYMRAVLSSTGAFPTHVAHNPQVGGRLCGCLFRLGRITKRLGISSTLRESASREVPGSASRIGMAHPLSDPSPELLLLSSLETPQPAYQFSSGSSPHLESRLHLERSAYLHYPPAQRNRNLPSGHFAMGYYAEAGMASHRPSRQCTTMRSARNLGNADASARLQALRSQSPPPSPPRHKRLPPPQPSVRQVTCIQPQFATLTALPSSAPFDHRPPSPPSTLRTSDRLNKAAAAEKPNRDPRQVVDLVRKNTMSSSYAPLAGAAQTLQGGIPPVPGSAGGGPRPGSAGGRPNSARPVTMAPNQNGSGRMPLTSPGTWFCSTHNLPIPQSNLGRQSPRPSQAPGRQGSLTVGVDNGYNSIPPVPAVPASAAGGTVEYTSAWR
ncbi:hypothetical protein BKA70DRAFT_1286545 [Coprinopsis sp. MPI-PUGE-AT-0042]|nr:hypothetical protein BKA70DRAFT_1286545 [Coprinopsis sp. MPI-PUGE-AT-0042]